jgi:endogenous inhibitor of DNA gyrase (YacG/DUF329 family)
MNDKVVKLDDARAQQEAAKSNGRKCANCGKPVVHKFRPFCSKRCSQLDLGRWLNEEYTVPVVEYDDIEDAEDMDGVLGQPDHPPEN